MLCYSCEKQTVLLYKGNLCWECLAEEVEKRSKEEEVEKNRKEEK